jgi:hypothetical protein
VGWPLVAGRGLAWRGTSHCDKVGAAVLVLVLVDTVCVGGERFVGGVVGAAGAVEVH